MDRFGATKRKLRHSVMWANQPRRSSDPSLRRRVYKYRIGAPLQKRFYIMFVTRDAEGELRKIQIPLHYLYVFMVGALIGMLSITGMAGSYTRMLSKVMRFNQLRTEKEALKTRYTQLEQVAKEKDIQVASLGTLASDVSSLYGLKSGSPLTSEAGSSDEAVQMSVDQLYALRQSAMNGAATIGIGMGVRQATITDWLRMAEAPNLWPVKGRIPARSANALTRSTVKARSTAGWTSPPILDIAYWLRLTAW